MDRESKVMFCFHKYGEVDNKGYQYCTKCGKARFVGPKCFHVWKTIHTGSSFAPFGGGYCLEIFEKCEKCGKIRKREVS